MKKVQSGQRLSIPASDYNAFIEAALDHRGRQANQGQDLQPSSSPGGMVLVRNNTGVKRDRFDVLGIDGPAILPSVNEGAFAERVICKGVVPATVAHTGRFMVLAEPLDAGRVGRAFAYGICPVKVDVPAGSASLMCAEIVNNTYTNLKAAQDGSARIVWRAGGSGVQWALVHLGAGRAGCVVRSGKAAADYSSGNTITLTPCISLTNPAPTGEPNITVTILSPSGASPMPIIQANDLLAFVSFINWAGQEESVLLPVAQKGLPAGTGQRKVLQLDASNQPFWGYVESI